MPPAEYVCTHIFPTGSRWDDAWLERRKGAGKTLWIIKRVQ